MNHSGIIGPLGDAVVMVGIAVAFSWIPNTWVGIGVTALFVLANGADYAEGRLKEFAG